MRVASGGTVYVLANGGLGNQLFQFAFGLAQARRQGKKLIVQSHWSEPNTAHRRFELPEVCRSRDYFSTSVLAVLAEKMCHGNSQLNRRIGKRMQRWLNRGTYRNYGMRYDEQALAHPWRRYEGLWQCYRYFEHLRDELLTLLSPLRQLATDDDPVVRLLRRDDTLALQVRRGDFFSHPQYRHTHGIDLSHYYERAIHRFEQRAGVSPQVCLFSDDPEPQRYVPTLQRRHLRWHNLSSPDPKLDMSRMAKARALAMANSTFGWWAAYLADRQAQITMCPTLWLREIDHRLEDIYLPDWIQIPVTATDDVAQ